MPKRTSKRTGVLQEQTPTKRRRTTKTSKPRQSVRSVESSNSKDGIERTSRERSTTHEDSRVRKTSKSSPRGRSTSKATTAQQESSIGKPASSVQQGSSEVVRNPERTQSGKHKKPSSVQQSGNTKPRKGRVAQKDEQHVRRVPTTTNMGGERDTTIEGHDCEDADGEAFLNSLRRIGKVAAKQRRPNVEVEFDESGIPIHKKVSKPIKFDEIPKVPQKPVKDFIQDVQDISNPVPRTGSSELHPLLNVKWSKFIPHMPTPKQLAAMMLSHIKELLFGGALGGGKSDWLAMEALRFCDLPGFSAILFRRQLTDLKQPGSLISRIGEWLSPHAAAGLCKYVGDEHAWLFKTTYPGTDIPGPDARLQFGYIGEAAVRERYQSAEYQLAGFDELGQWPDATDYLFMSSRLRKIVCPIHKKDDKGNPIFEKGCRYCDTLSQIPLRLRAATNPGPAWIKQRFGIVPDPSQFKNRHQALIAIAEGAKVRWVGINPERRFIASYLDDNPYLDTNDYKDILKEMTDDERSRLEDGNWESRKNARFKRRWQKFYSLSDTHYAYVFEDIQGNEIHGDPIPLTSLHQVFTTVDTAVTVNKGPVDGEMKQKNSYAVISTWGVTFDQNLLWLDCRKFRKEIPDLVEQIVEVDYKYQPKFHKIECNGVGIGTAQYVEAAGLRVKKNYRKTDKLENSMSAQLLMKAGRIYFPINAPWLEVVEDDVFTWTGLPTEEDDIVDTLSDAATEIALGLAQEISAPNVIRSKPISVSTAPGHGYNIPSYGLRPNYRSY